jgi:hypothetical protein
MCSTNVFRPLAITLLSANLGVLAQVPNPGSEGKIQLQWAKQYDEALKRAEAEKKPVLIDVTTDWCGWSKKMDRETFADLTVQKELRGFVLIRLNPEVSERNRKIAESYGVDGYPTIIVANYRGEEIGQGGCMLGNQFVEFLRRFSPMFKGNSLGYKSVQLQGTDPLLSAMRKIPAPESRPTSVGSFVVLDQSEVQLLTNGVAKFLVRTATFIADREKGLPPDVTRHYVSSRQKLKLKTVRILDTTGKGREVDVKSAKDEHAYSNQNVYWDARTVSLDLPTLKDGQVLDVIEEREFQPVMPNQFYFRWNTGTTILLTSDLKITFPAAFNLHKRAVRCPTGVTESRNLDGTITWQLKTSNTKPYEPELFSPPIQEIWQGYEFYTPCTKDQVAIWFRDLCRGRDVLPAAARQKVAELKKSNGTQTALLQALVNWVTRDVRYVSILFGASSHQPHSAAETLANLYGDCKDQSLLLAALCHEAGIPASPVVVDAFGEGFDEASPAIDCFNHCIVEATADGKVYYVDAAAGPAKLGHVARSYAGARALKLNGATGQVVTIPPYQPLMDQQVCQTVIKLNPNCGATVTESVQFNGEQAVLMKERMKQTAPEKVRQVLEASYKRSGRKLLDFFMTDAHAAGDSYETRLSYTVPRFGSPTAGGVVLKLAAQESETDWVGALNQPRTQPFRFRASDAARRSFTVELPAGALLKGKPEDLQLETIFMKANRKIVFKDNKLSATETSSFLDARLAPTESGRVYEAFRRLHDHREYSFVVEMPTPETPVAAVQGPARVAGTPPQGPAKMLRLSGISGMPPNRLAIINGKTLAAGEAASLKLDNRELIVRCLSIGDRSVFVSIDGLSGATELQLSN